MLELTQRQRDILQWITAYIQSNWRPPTVVEIGDHFGVKGASAYNIVRALIKKGYLEKGDHSARSIRPVNLALASEAGIDTRLRRTIQASESISGVSGFSGSLHVGRRLGHCKPLFTVEIRGNSMVEAGIFDGDTAVVRVQEEVEDGDIAVVSVGFEAMIRRIFFDDDGGALLVAEDKDVENLTVGADELVVYGKVVAVHRELE